MHLTHQICVSSGQSLHPIFRLLCHRTKCKPVMSGLLNCTHPVIVVLTIMRLIQISRLPHFKESILFGSAPHSFHSNSVGHNLTTKPHRLSVHKRVKNPKLFLEASEQYRWDIKCQYYCSVAMDLSMVLWLYLSLPWPSGWWCTLTPDSTTYLTRYWHNTLLSHWPTDAHFLRHSTVDLNSWYSER